MGAVYKARHIHLDKLIVLKILDKESATDKMLVRFHNEAKILCQLVHANISQYFDFGVSEDNQPYLAIEFIEGKTLSNVLKDNQEIPLLDVLQIAIQICEALDYAHGKGIVHRDVKSSNVVIAETELGFKAVLLDFGIAQLLDSKNSQGQFLTPTGELIGSPRYMSPEQTSGIDVDEKSDQYSLACVLYEMLSQRAPIVGESVMETLALKKSEVAPLLTQVTERLVPKELDQAVSIMLSRNPEDRYKSMNEVRLNLLSVMEDLLSSDQETHNDKVEFEPESDQITSTKFYKNKYIYVLLIVIIFPIVIGYSLFKATEVKEESKIELTNIFNTIDFPVESSRGNIENRTQLVIKSKEDIEKLKELRRYANLQDLEVSLADNLPPICLDYITDAKKLISLKISAKKFKLTELKSLKKLKYLNGLSLNGSTFSESDIEELIPLKNLSNLNIVDTLVTADDLFKLQKLTSLNYVELSQDLVRTKQFKVLRRLVPNCSFVPVAFEESKGSVYLKGKKKFIKKTEIKSKIRVLREREEKKIEPIQDTILRNKMAYKINKECYRIAVEAQGKISYAAGFYLLESIKNQAYSMDWEQLVKLVKDVESNYKDYFNIVFRAKTYRGDVLWNAGKQQESLVIAKDSLLDSKKIFFAESPQISDCYERIFYRLYHTGQPESSAEVATVAIEYVNKWCEPEDKQIGNINLKALRVTRGLAPQSEKMADAARSQCHSCINWFELRKEKKILDKENDISTYIEALFTLVTLETDLKSKKSHLFEATKWLIRNRVIAQKNPHMTTDCYVNLARIYLAENNLTEAEKLFENAIVIIDSLPRNQQGGKAVAIRKELLNILKKEKRVQEVETLEDQLNKLQLVDYVD